MRIHFPLSSFSIKKMGLIVVALFIVLSFFASHQSQITQPNFAPIESQLQDIKTQLSQLQQHMAHAEKEDLTTINEDLRQLKSLIKELKSKNESEMNQFMQENNSALTTKLKSIENGLNTLNQKQHPIQYLALTALPFQLVSVDSIQQTPVVSVLYNYKVIPLEKNDSLAGWTVVGINFGKQTAEFINNKKEHVVARLESDKGEAHA